MLCHTSWAGTELLVLSLRARAFLATSRGHRCGIAQNLNGEDEVGHELCSSLVICTIYFCILVWPSWLSNKTPGYIYRHFVTLSGKLGGPSENLCAGNGLPCADVVRFPNACFLCTEADLLFTGDVCTY